MRAGPWLAAALAGAAGMLAAGPVGIAFAGIGAAAALLPRAARPLAVLPLALVPAPALSGPEGWACSAALAGAGLAVAADSVGTVPRPAWLAATGLAVLAAGAIAAVPRLHAFFAADAGLAAFLVGGAALFGLGLGAATVPLDAEDAR